MAFGFQGDGRIDHVHLGSDGDTGRHFHQNNKGNAGEDDCPQQSVLELNTNQGSGGNGTGANECAGNNGRRAHILQLLHKGLFFHYDLPPEVTFRSHFG